MKKIFVEIAIFIELKKKFVSHYDKVSFGQSINKLCEKIRSSDGVQCNFSGYYPMYGQYDFSIIIAIDKELSFNIEKEVLKRIMGYIEKKYDVNVIHNYRNKKHEEGLIHVDEFKNKKKDYRIFSKWEIPSSETKHVIDMLHTKLAAIKEYKWKTVRCDFISLYENTMYLSIVGNINEVDEFSTCLDVGLESNGYEKSSSACSSVNYYFMSKPKPFYMKHIQIFSKVQNSDLYGGNKDDTRTLFKILSFVVKTYVKPNINIDF